MTYANVTFGTSGNISLSNIPYVITGSGTGGGAGLAITPNSPYYSTSTNWGSATPALISQSGKLDLTGKDADIVINGESLTETLKEIKELLRIPSKLASNPELEHDWEELQAARKHYEMLLKEYKEKQQVWDTLAKDFDN